MEPCEDDHSLAVRARDGDREALSALVERLRSWLFAVALAETRRFEDAQEAVAEALLRVCSGIRRLRRPGRFRGWAAAIVRNEARRIGRRASRLPDADGGSVLGGDDACLRIDLERALRALPADQARALTHFYLAGVSIREIARRTGRPEGTVKSWLHEGRKRLAREMKEYAPMTEQWTAAIVSTELGQEATQPLSESLRRAGWDRVTLFDQFSAAAEVRTAGEGDEREFHLPPALAEARLIILDEWIGGRSAFELLPILNAASERKTVRIGLLVESASQSTSFAAWAAGVDLFLDKPVDPSEFHRFAERLRRDLESGS